MQRFGAKTPEARPVVAQLVAAVEEPSPGETDRQIKAVEGLREDAGRPEQAARAARRQTAATAGRSLLNQEQAPSSPTTARRSSRSGAQPRGGTQPHRSSSAGTRGRTARWRRWSKRPKTALAHERCPSFRSRGSCSAPQHPTTGARGHHPLRNKKQKTAITAWAAGQGSLVWRGWKGRAAVQRWSGGPQWSPWRRGSSFCRMVSTIANTGEKDPRLASNLMLSDFLPASSKDSPTACQWCRPLWTGCSRCLPRPAALPRR